MKKILGLTIAALMVIGMVGGGTYAYFSDVETSASNILTAGTLDLKTNDADGVTATLDATNMAPADIEGPATVTLKNAGSLDGASLDIDISYVESDGSEPTDAGLANDLTADEFADELLVDTLTYGGTDLLTGITDADADGIDMKEVAAADLTGQAGINATLSKDFVVQVTLKSGAGNDVQGDGIDVTFTFTLNQ